MGNSIVQSQMNDVKVFLEETAELLGQYLDHHEINLLLNEDGSKEKGYYHNLLKTLRRIEVFCQEALDAVTVILHSEPFRRNVAEKTLYRIYHKCIVEFFSPKDDVWHEDSRALYTGKNAIKFLHEPPASIKMLIRRLEPDFQRMREELDYYEIDVQPNRAMNQNRRSSES
ncbi:MAG: DUF3907 family protein [Bacillaceae bacterium]|nr:DUF3907 family protein [Bacillaceae bacterium]